MVPRTQANRRQRPGDIRNDIIEVKLPVIRQDILKELRANSKDACANEQREVETPSPRGVEDPVEAGCEDEEGKEMEEFVVYYGVDLQRSESGIPRCCDEEEECSCVMSVGAAKGRGCGKSEPAKGSLIRILRDVL